MNREVVGDAVYCYTHHLARAMCTQGVPKSRGVSFPMTLSQPDIS